MAYELWNRESANIVGEFDTEGEALAFVRDMVDMHGVDVVVPWALAYEDAEEETHSIAIGVDLLSRAQEAVLA
jgi:hypothetical protein